MTFDPVKYAHEKTNLALYYQSALGFAFPPIYPLKNIIKVPAVDVKGVEPNGALTSALQKGLKQMAHTLFVTPLTLQLETENFDSGFQLPVDPIISISGKNKIIRRNVAKSELRGTIKESWNQDDYEIVISGLLQTDEFFHVQEYQQRLIEYCESKKAVTVYCNLLNDVFGITKIAIDDYSFAFTSGEENQLFSIKAYSDEPYELLIELR